MRVYLRTHRASFYTRLFKVFKRPQDIVQDNVTDDVIDRVDKTLVTDTYFLAMEELYVLLKNINSHLNSKKYFSQKWTGMDQSRHVFNTIQKIDDRIKFGHTFARAIKQVYGDIELVLVMPRFIQIEFEKLGYRVNRNLSSLFWFIESLLSFGTAVKLLAKNNLSVLVELFAKEQTPRFDTLFYGLTSIEFSDDPMKNNAVEFVKSRTLPPFQIPLKTMILRDFKKDIEVIEKEEIILAPRPWMFLNRSPNKVISLFKIFLSAKILFALNLLGLISGRWWEIVQFDELAVLPRVREWFKYSRPKHIVTTFSYFIEPLWISFCSQMGSENWLAFYSTHNYCLNYKNEHPHTELEPVQRFQNWDKYAVWDQEHKKYFEFIGYPSKDIVICGPIIFARVPKNIVQPLPILQQGKPTIGIFDTEPFKAKFIFGFCGFGKWYYSLANVTKFVDDIHRAATQVYGSGNFRLLFKPKRQAGIHTDPRYKDFVDQMKSRSEVIIPDPFTNLFEVVKECDQVISVPFTSVSRLGKLMGRRAAFYDSTGNIRDLPIRPKEPILLSSFSDLVQWFEESKNAKSFLEKSP